ncbi:NADH-quinone oxidoreductase subunit L [Wolbachia endosymbiont of Howardula sp.]|uniref:NADH-quinone oxidoreductase subunit L n=1 Tax=Wolbachia endosymbiont of Howardula sp. TaxID=2916816 RepID=UPI00217ED62C|nr:NADH-quinone oxidoreductase subunit L [Wolbachia endosymbiont of Howardula sp.]UWI83220.1 NADH-quinone oxidoreductase subunit L [Wolbachia endosymbiont of Howardula sp.]
MYIILTLLVFFPLLGSCYAVYMRKNTIFSGQIISTGCIGISMLFSWYIFLTFSHNIHLILFPLIYLEKLKVDWVFNIDILSSIMLIIITTISFVVHLYSIGYMEHDKTKRIFFSYLSLFTFFMMIMVMSDNFLQLFFGWEGVGVCSYLLIGFWFHKPSANRAAFKAFLVNRIGDCALLIGIFIIYHIFHTLKFIDIFDQIDYIATQNLDVYGNTIHVICILLFIGAMAKSVQLGLHIWLPDAMEGPTPVSALIHSATMVTSGIFLIAKCSPLFALSEITREIIVIIGACTAIFGATVAMTENNIKKIIAYSTCSQLGYMSMACGLSAYNIAIFHLMTHACFKALLFLGAGNIIYTMNNEQNIHKMENCCWNKMPFTYAMMCIGTLALSGIFPFAGFYSKDLIIDIAYHTHKFAFVVSLIVTCWTSLYAWRLLIIVFHSHKTNNLKIIRPPKIMCIPLLILAFGAMFSGIWGIYILDITSNIFWQSSLEFINHNDTHNFFIKLLPMIVSMIGITLAWLIYYYHIISQIKNQLLSSICQNKWYFDQFYSFFIVKPIRVISQYLYSFDIAILDTFGPKALIKLINKCSNMTLKLHTGYIFDYAFIMFCSLIFFSLYVIRMK